jgi:hypothetical protein
MNLTVGQVRSREKSEEGHGPSLQDCNPGSQPGEQDVAEVPENRLHPEEGSDHLPPLTKSYLRRDLANRTPDVLVEFRARATSRRVPELHQGPGTRPSREFPPSGSRL